MDKNNIHQLPLLGRYLPFRNFIKHFIIKILCQYIPTGSIITGLVRWGYKKLVRIYKLQIIFKKKITI